MRLRGIASIRFIAAVATSLAIGCVLAVDATGERPPTETERRAIHRVVLKDCERRDADCRRARIRVSTANRRYAFGGAAGGNFYGGALVKRNKASTRWRVVMVQGGGLQACRTWHRRAPRRVLRDLNIQGFVPGYSTGRPCWKRYARASVAACAPPRRVVAGVGGIYSLHGRHARCRLARQVVRRYHAKRIATTRNDQRVFGFNCSGRYSAGGEGLGVSCRRRNGRRVSWDAYLDR